MADSDLILEAVSAVGKALKDTHYAIIGGAACALLGSDRETRDVDLVVVRGGTAAARARLKSSPGFRVEARTMHTYYGHVPVEILAPPALFKGEFTPDTPTVEISGAKVLEPACLLNTKCGSIRERSSDSDKGKDAADIKFLLDWFIGEERRISLGTKDREEVPNVTKEFIAEFVMHYGRQSLWDEVFGVS